MCVRERGGKERQPQLEQNVSRHLLVGQSPIDLVRVHATYGDVQEKEEEQNGESSVEIGGRGRREASGGRGGGCVRVCSQCGALFLHGDRVVICKRKIVEDE